MSQTPAGQPASREPAANDNAPCSSYSTQLGANTQSPVAQTSLVLTAGSSPVADYQLIELLGRGGFGEVWKVMGPGGVITAMKFIRRTEAIDEVERRSLELMKNIHHPHLIGVSGVWERQDLLIIAMELGERTLKQRLQEALALGQPGIPMSELHEYIHDAAKGIDYLGSLRIVHRDIKPQNLLLVGGGVKVADFGLAKLLEHTAGNNTGAMTPTYAAPEFFEGQASSQSDQYALAVTYCELRTGKLPLGGNTLAEIMHKHLTAAPDLSQLSPAEQPVLARALAKNQSTRWPDCRSFVRALLQPPPMDRLYDTVGPAGVGSTTLPRPVSRTSGSRFTNRQVLWILLTAIPVLAIVVALTLWLTARGHDPLVELRRQEIERVVSIITSSPPVVIRHHPEGSTEVDRLEPDDLSGIDLLTDERVVDLRLWKDVPPDHLHELYSAVTNTRRVRAKKITAATELKTQARTSGLELFMNCPSPYPSRVNIQRGDTFVGTDRMKARQLVIDIGAVPVDTEFDFRTVSTYWNSLQTEQEQWFGVIGYERSFKVSMLVLFPADKPYKEYSLMVAKTVRDQPMAYDGPKILLSGPHQEWLYWEVPQPQTGYVYRLHWKW